MLNNMKNILVMVFHFPPMSGGGSVLISDIVNGFQSLGHKVHVITPDITWEGVEYHPHINENIKITQTQTPARDKIKVAARLCQKNMKKKAVELGKETNFDFIFSVFHPFHLVANGAVDAARELKIPAIIKVDDAVFADAKGLKAIQRKIEKRISSKAFKDATMVLAVNSHVSGIIFKEYKIKSEKIMIMPNGINFSMTSKDGAEKFFDYEIKRKKKIIFTGAMYDHRGLDVLLDAIPKVNSEISGVKFVLIGDGPELENLKTIAKKKNLKDSVEFTGWINRENIPANIKDASIGIGPLKLSTVTRGSMPIKVLEYMAASLPIIAKRGTLPDKILHHGENGYFIDDSSELAEKIIHILESEERVFQMGKKSREISKDFEIKTVLARLLDKIDDL